MTNTGGWCWWSGRLAGSLWAPERARQCTTVFHKRSTLFTAFPQAFYFIYRISLFQASVALIVTDLNLVLLLYYFIIAYVTLP